MRTKDEGGAGCGASPGFSRQQELHVQRPRGTQGIGCGEAPEAQGVGCGETPEAQGTGCGEAPEAWGAGCGGPQGVGRPLCLRSSRGVSATGTEYVGWREQR